MQAALEADLQSHIERHAGGVADLDALARQLQAAQSTTAALGAEAAELRAEVRGPLWQLKRHRCMDSCGAVAMWRSMDPVQLQLCI